jgi:creatinine amidohydrolase
VKYRLGHFTAAEVVELLGAKPVVLVPLGSHENQGPHAPMGDYLSAEKIGELIAERASAAGVRTVLAPAVPYGGADFFGSVPGGIALSQGTFRAVIGEIFGCLLRHGLNRIVVLNGHGGNTQAIHDVTQVVWRERGLLIPSFYLWKVAKTLLQDIVGPDVASRSIGHGGDPLTSIASHLFPELLRPDLLPPPNPPPQALGLPVSGFGTVRFDGVDLEVPLELDGIAKNGIFGADARLCSAETGATLVDQLVNVGARFVRHYAEQCA